MADSAINAVFAPGDEIRVRRLLASGLRAVEVANKLKVSTASLSAFMRRNGIQVLAGRDIPPPDLSRTDKTIIYLRRADPLSGGSRLHRCSVPANTMHRLAIMESRGHSEAPMIRDEVQ